jgi:hypothetical protein
MSKQNKQLDTVKSAKGSRASSVASNGSSAPPTKSSTKAKGKKK